MIIKGVPLLPSAHGWVWGKDGQKYKRQKRKSKNILLPPSSSFEKETGLPKLKNFPIPFKRKKSARAKSKKCGKIFSVLERKFFSLKRFAGGSGGGENQACSSKKVRASFRSRRTIVSSAFLLLEASALRASAFHFVSSQSF